MCIDFMVLYTTVMTCVWVRVFVCRVLFFTVMVVSNVNFHVAPHNLFAFQILLRKHSADSTSRSEFNQKTSEFRVSCFSLPKKRALNQPVLAILNFPIMLPQPHSLFRRMTQRKMALVLALLVMASIAFGIPTGHLENQGFKTECH